MADFLEINFCKQRTLRINREFDVQGFDSEDLAGATSLGCRFPVSRRVNGPGFILVRVDKQSGQVTKNLLFSENEILVTNPGPSAHLSGCPVKVVDGDVTLPFPQNEGVITPHLFWNGAPVPFPGQVIGLGSNIGFRRMVVLPPGNVELLDPGTKANHTNKTYAAVVSSPNATESYRLTFINASTPLGFLPLYIWQSVSQQGTTVTQFATGNWEHHIGFSLVGTAPALLGHEGLFQTPPVAFSTAPLPGPTSVNGPDQTQRKFSFQLMGGGFNPDFGGAVDENFNLVNGRPTMTIFAQSGFLDSDFGGFSTFTVGGTPLTFQAATIPQDQFQLRPFIGEDPLNPWNFFNSGFFVISTNPAIQGMLHGPCNRVAQLEVPVGADEVNVVIQTADSAVLPSTFSLPLPKGIGQICWTEGVITVWSRHVGAL